MSTRKTGARKGEGVPPIFFGGVLDVASTLMTVLQGLDILKERRVQGHGSISYTTYTTTCSKSRYFSPKSVHSYDPSKCLICPHLPGAIDTKISPHVRRGSEVKLLDGTTRRLRFPPTNWYATRQSGYGYFNIKIIPAQ